MSRAPIDSRLDIRFLDAAAPADLRRQPLEAEVTELFEQCRAPLLRYLSTFGLPQQDAEETVQEVFLALFSHLLKNKARTNLRGWLFRVAHNLALKRRNSERTPVEVEADVDSVPDPGLNPEEELVSNRKQQRLSSVLQALPRQDRRCLYLRAEGLRYREIAEVLGISLGSVALSLERSLARFQRSEQR